MQFHLELQSFLFIWITSVLSLECNRAYQKRDPTLCKVIGGSISENQEFFLSNFNYDNMTKISFNSLELSALPKNMFNSYMDVTTFQICCSNIGKISPEDFTDALYLKHFLINSTKLQKIPSKLFAHATKLQSIEIINTQTTHIDNGAFHGLKNLKFLQLKNLPLECFPSDMLADLTTLTEIKMKNCSLESLPKGFFSENLHLIRINLEHNKLKSISDDDFDNRRIKEIHLNFNQIGILPGLNCVNIRVTNNKLRQVHISNATVALKASNNLIKDVTCDANLNLTFIQLDHNSLSNISCLGEMKKAGFIELNNNSLEEVDGLKDIRNVYHLRLDSNPLLKSTNVALGSLKKLRSFNSDELPFAFENITGHHSFIKTIGLNTITWNCSYLLNTILTLKAQKIHFISVQSKRSIEQTKCQQKVDSLNKF